MDEVTYASFWYQESNEPELDSIGESFPEPKQLILDAIQEMTEYFEQSTPQARARRQRELKAQQMHRDWVNHIIQKNMNKKEN